MKAKVTTVRIPPEVFSRIVEQAERRGRSINTTIVDLIESGFDWLRTRFQAIK